MTNFLRQYLLYKKDFFKVVNITKNKDRYIAIVNYRNKKYNNQSSNGEAIFLIATFTVFAELFLSLLFILPGMWGEILLPVIHLILIICIIWSSLTFYDKIGLCTIAICGFLACILFIHYALCPEHPITAKNFHTLYPVYLFKF